MTMTVLMILGHADGTGAHRMAAQFARAFHREGHRPILVCGPGRKADSDPLLLGESRDPASHGVPVLRRGGFQRSFSWSLASELAGLVTSEGADCVVAFQQADRKHAMLAARRAGVPCVIHAGNPHLFWGPWPLPALKEWVYGHLLRRYADLVVCTSRTVERDVTRRFRVPAARTRVQPNGIDVRGFPRPAGPAVESVRDELGIGHDEPMLVNVGRLDVQKGQDVLLRAFAPIADARPDAKLVLVGAITESGNQERMERFNEGLHDFIASRGLENQVRFTGWRDDVSRLLGAADLYVHASRWEGPALCLSVLEAMAAGLPIVSTDCSGRPRGFEDGTQGFIVGAEAVEPLREAIEHLLERSHEERCAMGRQARALALTRYDSRDLSTRFVEHVEGLLARARTEESA